MSAQKGSRIVKSEQKFHNILVSFVYLLGVAEYSHDLILKNNDPEMIFAKATVDVVH